MDLGQWQSQGIIKVVLVVFLLLLLLLPLVFFWRFLSYMLLEISVYAEANWPHLHTSINVNGIFSIGIFQSNMHYYRDTTGEYVIK